MTKQSTSGGTEEWYGQTVEAKSDPLIDTGTGHTVVMRFFEFKADPIVFKRDNPSNQDLFNAHAQQIRIMLWGDGLEPFNGIEPKIIREKNKYKIMVTCIPKAGTTILEKPKNLKELIKSNG